MKVSRRTSRIRSSLTAALVAASLAAGPALADDVRVEGEVIVPDRDRTEVTTRTRTVETETTGISDYGEPIDMRYVEAEEDAFAYERAPNKAVGVAESITTLLFNSFFFPVKMAIGVGGAALGGTIGAMSGGDERAAAQIWNVTTDGSYFTTPSKIEGRSEFRLTGDHP